MRLAPASQSNRAPLDRRLSMLQDALLVIVTSAFFYVHARQVVVEGSLRSVGFGVEQALLVGMFLTRRRSIATSRRPVDWLLGAGAWISILARPAASPTEWASTMGVSLQMIGLAGTCIGFIYLGRSFGVVAANRGIKVRGPYRVVRHPIYVTHLITHTGFVLANFSPYNAALLAGMVLIQFLRIRAEERLLTQTGDYADYAARVRWRLVPGLY
jgi:protein-S-isoprenylcysteine O-methyltransferase Ste14